jgi:hypothetical protein
MPGNIKLQGRARELIVLPNGMNVWPQDVEDVPALGASTIQDARPRSRPPAAAAAARGTCCRCHRDRTDLTAMLAAVNTLCQPPARVEAHPGGRPTFRARRH